MGTALKAGDLKSIIGEISDIFGIIRKNYTSYHSFRDDIRQRAFEKKIDGMLERLVRFRGSNQIVLSHLLSWSGQNAPSGIDGLEEELSFLLENSGSSLDRGPDFEFHEILTVLKDLREALEEISSEFIRHNHQLYERLERAVYLRIRVVEFLKEGSNENVSKERFAELANVYQALIEDLTTCKAELTSLRKGPEG